MQMVYHHHEYRRVIDHTPPTTLQRTVASDYFSYLLCSQPGPLPLFHSNILSEIHSLSRDISRCTPTPTPELIPSNIPGQPCHHREHDGPGLCSCLGSRNGYAGMGVMVDGQRYGFDDMLPPDLGDVSASASNHHSCVLELSSDVTYSLSNRRSDLAEMTALYFIPIVAVVIAAASGSFVAGSIPNIEHQLWTLIISYILWGIGTPLSWIILTIYFLRMTIHKPLQREVVVSLLLPIGPLGLSGFS